MLYDMLSDNITNEITVSISVIKLCFKGEYLEKSQSNLMFVGLAF